MPATLKIGDQIGLASTALGDIKEVRGPIHDKDSDAPYWSVCYHLDGRTLWIKIRDHEDRFTDLAGNPLHHRFRFKEEPNGQLSIV